MALIKKIKDAFKGKEVKEEKVKANHPTISTLDPDIPVTKQREYR